MLDGDKLVNRIKTELAWGRWFQLLKTTQLYDPLEREELRRLITQLGQSKN